MKKIDTIKIQGFKSIARAELVLGDLNVIIGANGSGKSNLIGVFRLLERVLTHHLQLYVASEPDRLLHHGRKITPALTVDVTLGENAYGFKLKAVQDTLVFEYERNGADLIGVGHKESKLEDIAPLSPHPVLKPGLPEWGHLMVYHFHDTSDTSPAKQTVDVDDNRYFRPDAANLPAYLYWLQEKHPVQFRHIEEHIRLVAPFFEKLILAPSRLNEKKIKLEWRHKGSEAYFDAYSLSDGTLRFICLATLLLQPDPPPLILLDEPELGLHPFAIRLLADMLAASVQRVQVVLATQSVTLLNHFPLENVIVVEHDGLQTLFNRLDDTQLRNWLDEFSLGDLWEKNVIGGRP